MLTTPIKTPEVLINVRCLYAEQDAMHKEQLAVHLEPLLHRHKIDQLRFEEVGELMITKFSVKKIVASTDLIILIVTSQFLASDFSYSTELSHLLEARKLGNIQLIPLVFTPCRIETSILHKIPRLPSNVEPLINEHTRHLERPLFIVSGELENRIERIRFYKDKIEKAWDEARALDEFHGYQDFIAQFPFSLQCKEAQQRADKMLEAKLWKEAETLDDITHLLHYLKDAPEIPAKAERKLKALDRIIEIEASEAVAGGDAIDSQNLPLLFNYLQRFPYGSQSAAAHTQVGDLMDDLLNGRKLSEHLEMIGEQEEETGEITEINTEGLRLRYLAFHLLKPDELMALDSYYKFGEGILRKAKQQSGQLKGNANLILMGAPVFLLFAYAFYLLLAPRIGDMGLILYILVILSAGLIYVLTLAYRYMIDDARICLEMAIDLQRKLTELRISFLFRDRRSINRLLFEFFNAQGRLQQFSALGIGHYLWNQSEELPKGRKANSAKLNSKS